MTVESERSRQIQEITGLRPKHFADLVRTTQLIFDPAAGLSGRNVSVDWEALGISQPVVENLKQLGNRYRYASPTGVPIDSLWDQLLPETRSWFIDHHKTLWQFEELFPPLDED